MKATINAKGTEISVLSKGDENDFISLTDIARYKNPEEPKDVVKNWMRSRSTIEFLGLWEQLNYPNFKGVEFDSFIHEAGSNRLYPITTEVDCRYQRRGLAFKVWSIWRHLCP